MALDNTEADLLVEDVAPWNAGEHWNDAYIYGEPSAEFDALMEKEIPVTVGAYFDKPYPKGKRSSPDDKWNADSVTWRQFAEGEDTVKRFGTPWGLTRHPENGRKDGVGYVFGRSANGYRKSASMREMSALSLDIDAGIDLDTVVDIIEKSGYACFLYTSYNHSKKHIDIPRDDLKGVSDESVREYLRGKNNAYSEDFLAQVTVSNPRKDVGSAIVVRCSCPELQKVRLVFPLAELVDVTKLDPDKPNRGSAEIWGDNLRGLADMLGLPMDEACVDPSRLFFAGRRPRGAADWYAGVFRGAPIRWGDVPCVPKPSRRVSAARSERVTAQVEGKTVDVSTLYDAYAKRWEIADLIEAHAPDRVRDSDGSKLIIDCPFEASHSNPDEGSGTFCVNAIDGDNGFAIINCQHSCKETYHFRDYLAKMLEDRWFPVEALEDPNYLLEIVEEEIGKFSRLTPAEEDERREQLEVSTREANRSFEERAGAFDKTTTEAEVRALFVDAFQHIDLTGRGKLNEVVAKRTNLGKMDAKRVWRELDKEADGEKRRKARGGRNPASIVDVAGFAELCEYGAQQIEHDNTKKPFLFHNVDDLCAIRAGSDGRHAIRALNKDGFKYYLNESAGFVTAADKDGNLKSASAPRDVVDHLFAADRSAYPSLRGIITTPIFTPSGSLLTQPGYDSDSQLYFQPDSRLRVPKVPDKPTQADVREALDLIVRQCLADFPLGGLNRKEILHNVLGCEEVERDFRPVPAVTKAVPDVAHTIAVALQPFVRDLVGGLAPGFAFSKMLAGTGATKLVGVLSMIYGGRSTPAMALPTTKEEMTKVLLPVLRGGDPFVFFDNINDTVDSGELASAMTAPTYMGRVLSQSSMMEVDVRCAWLISGNKLRLSPELIRRFVLINLDAQTAEPEKRTGWHHKDLEGWVLANRGKLIWACLVLIQNWIANHDMREGDYDKASYGAWARTMGGILDAAGVKGFLDNEGAMAALSAAEDDPVRLLVAHLTEMEAERAQEGESTVFVTGSTKRAPKGAVSIKDVLESFYDDNEALKIPHWGFDYDGTYSNTLKLGIAWKSDVGDVPHRVGNEEVTFVGTEHPGSKAKIWRMVRKRPSKADNCGS